MQHVCYWNDQILKPIQYGGGNETGTIAFEKLQHLLERIMLRRTKVGRADDMGIPPRVVNIRRDYFNEEEAEVSVFFLYLLSRRRTEGDTDFFGRVLQLYQSLFKDVKRKFNTYAEQGTVLMNYSNIFTLITRMRQVSNFPLLSRRFRFGKGFSSYFSFLDGRSSRFSSQISNSSTSSSHRCR